MRKSFLSLALGVSVCGHHVSAEPFDETKGDTFYKVSAPVQVEIVSPGQMSVDDYIVALSQASLINIIVDASNITPYDLVEKYPVSSTAKRWKLTPNRVLFVNLLADLCEVKRLSKLRYDKSTYLLWDQPNALETARLIVAAGKQRPAEPLPVEAALYNALNEYAKSPLQWQSDEGVGGYRFLTTPLTEVPRDLRAHIKAVVRHELMRPESRRELLLTDSHWKTARIRLVLTNRLVDVQDNQTRQVSAIHLSIPDENGKTISFIEPFESSVYTASGESSSSVYDFPTRRSSLKPRPATEVPPALPPAPAEDAVAPTPGLTAVQLEAEAPLQVKVSLEAKRRPLGELIADVAKKNGVKLVIGAGVPAQTALVTARVSEMPLGTLMGALARTYGVYWTKEGANVYLLHASEADALQTLLLRAGRGDFAVKDATYGADVTYRQQYRELEQQIVAELQGQGAEKPEGVAFSAVPEDLQLRLKQAVQEWVAFKLAYEYHRATKFVTDQSILMLSSKEYPDPSITAPEWAKVSAKRNWKQPEWTLSLLYPFDEKADYRLSLVRPTTLYTAPPPPQNEDQPPPAG